MSKALFDSRSYILGYTDATRQWGLCDRRFSKALLEAVKDEKFRFWYESHSNELNYAMHTMTAYYELLEFDDAPLLQRQIFLQLAALSMRDEGL